MEFACAWAHLSIFEIRVWCVARAQALPCCLLPYFTTSPPPLTSTPLFPPLTPRDLGRDWKARVFKGRSIRKRLGGGAVAAKEHDWGFYKHWSVRRNGCASNLCEQTACVFRPRRTAASFIFKQTSKFNYVHSERVVVHFVFLVFTAFSLW